MNIPIQFCAPVEIEVLAGKQACGDPRGAIDVDEVVETECK